ncbi:MAG: hypothetical protein J5687_01940 [Treponema sp.]|nr:hypothetical protein [Treponema sp.]
MKKLIVFLVSVFFSVAAFAQLKVISPIEGTFANRQMLVLETDGSGDCYYSLNGADPEAFGFAYDGPVLIDLDGPVEIRIAKTGKHKEEITVKYTVIPDSALTASYSSFISSFYDSGILNYTSGSILSIPESLMYSFGLPPDSFLTGRDLSISQSSVLTRYIPCTLLDDASGKKWRFIIKTFPQTAGVYSRRDVPFVITDWDTITFTNENYIYKIDSEYWELPKKSIKLDRSVSHMIRWQNLEYKEGNPIDFFVLPPKPELEQSTGDDGSLIFNLNGDASYSMSVLSTGGTSGSSSQYQELFQQLGVDTFYGDSVSGTLQIGFYTNSVYQGKIEVPFAINKRPPSTPLISSSSAAFYSREPVAITIKGESMSDLYYAVSEPYTITSASETYSADSAAFASIRADDFKKADSSSLSMVLTPEGNGAVYFKIAAYSKNEKNIGAVATYSVIIDQYNYYYNSFADSSIADGTALRPYATFDQCIEAVNKGRYACLRVKGSLVVPTGVHYILSNCLFVNESDASLEFEQGASLVVKNSNLTLENFTVCAAGDGKAVYKIDGIVPYFKLEDSVLDIKNSQIAAAFDSNGLFAEAIRSSVNVNGTIASVSATVYASFISGVRTNLNIQNSSINTTAATSVIVSLNQGDVYMGNNSFKISGEKGRVAEFFGVTATLEKNSYKASLKNSSNAAPVYADKASSLTQKDDSRF